MSASTLHRPAPAPAAPVPAPVGTGPVRGSAPRATARAGRGGLRGLSVGRKLAALAGVGALSTVFVTGVTLNGLGNVDASTAEAQTLGDAQALLLRLDTRSSELKVDGYKAAVREDATEQRAELADDTATAQGLLDELAALPLEGDLDEAVASVTTTYTGYFTQIGAYIEKAVGDQAAARTAFEDIQTANDAVDEALGGAIDLAQERESAATARLDDEVGTVRLLTTGAAVLGLAALAALGVLITRAITRPLRTVRSVLTSLADGDLTARADLSSGDEIGQMGDALDAAQSSLSRVLETMADNASALAAAAEELSATAGSIAASAEETSAQSGVVSAAAEQVSRNVQTVAVGADEMGASIREISQNANEAARVGASAVGIADATTSTVTRLGDSSRQIGDVVKTITSIAEQTNLLALNATIEAARAGEAGKGFAVVANEVKDLAQETAKATEDIGRRVEAIQADTAGAVAAIAEISTVIARMNDFQTTIASAVEEQTATTSEMSRNVGEAALGSSQIADNISGVATAATTTSNGVQDTQNAVAELARMSNELQTLVGSFRY